MPITTKPPSAAPDALELTSFTKRRLGLDAAKCWVILDEVNWFIWHGPDLLPVDAAAGRYVYGELPLALTQRLRRELEERVEAGALKIVVRTR